jgi:hypothetical protein
LNVTAPHFYLAAEDGAPLYPLAGGYDFENMLDPRQFF